MPYADIEGLENYYEIHGQGQETIVLLHNGFSCVLMWEDIYPGLVDAGYRILMIDRRGYGRSEAGPDFETYYSSYGFRDTSVAAMAALVDHLGMERFHIVGQCEGGVVGVDFAVRYPERVKTLTTASTLCCGKTSMTVFNAKKFPHTFQGLPAEIRQKYVQWHGPERAEMFYNICTRTGGGAYGTGDFDLRKQLTSVTCPSLVMYPDRGYFFDVEQAVSFYRHLPDGELAVFPRCGHNIHEHYPGEYVRQVVSFIGRCRQMA